MIAHDNNGNTQTMVNSSGTTSYYQADGLGPVTSLSNPAGAVAANYTYDSFGNIIATSGSSVSLYYYRARYYDPAAGRFLNEDPVRFLGGIQFYRYALNAATMQRDPTGLRPGDSYDTARIAALQALIDILATSNAEGLEYGGVIYKNWDGTYSYTAPKKGTPTSVDPGKCPFFKREIGTYHTHPDVPGYDSYDISMEDQFNDFVHYEYGWVALPNGKVLEDPPIGPAVPIGTIPGGVK